MKDMMTLLWAVPAIAAGICVAIQTGVNTQLRTYVGSPLQAAFISFLVGAFAIAIVLVIRREMNFSFSVIKTTPWWVWTGGLLGALYVSAIILIAPKIGAVATAIYIIFGQLLMSVILDHYGWLGFPKIALTPQRIVGVMCVFIGVLLVVKSPFQFNALK